MTQPTDAVSFMLRTFGNSVFIFQIRNGEQETKNWRTRDEKLRASVAFRDLHLML